MDATMDGIDRFVLWLDKQPSRKRAAQLLDCTVDQLSKWSLGRKRPSLAHRLIIEHFAGIPHLSWLTDDERQAYKHATGKALRVR